MTRAEKMKWIERTNIYEVNVRQYTREGTFNAFAKHLPRLKDMGVQTLWFMPVTPIAEKEKKGTLGSYYAAADYTSINPEFGTLEDFKKLVKTAQGMGFIVIIDWVANHTGWDHTWTKTHPEYYKKDADGNFLRASGMDDIIELDYSNEDMRSAMIDAMRFWIVETGIDGFRCDLAFWVELYFWVEAKAALETIKPLFWLAESDPLDHPEYMRVFDVAYTWAWMHRSRDWFQQKLPLSEFEAVVQRYQHTPGIKAWFTSNHDENSWNGTEYEKYGESAHALAVFTCTWPGVPLLYSGQELPNMKRLCFFDKDVIEWNEPYALHLFYKTLFFLKNSNPALGAKAAVERLSTGCDSQVLAYRRYHQTAEVIVFLNLSNEKADIVLSNINVHGDFKNIFSGTTFSFPHTAPIALECWDYLVLEKV